MELTESQEEWLQAMESGKYEQGTARLKQRAYDGDPWKFCCLGIACELYNEKFPEALTYEIVKDDDKGEVVAFDNNTGALPGEVMHHLRLFGSMGAPRRQGDFDLTHRALWELNDGRGTTTEVHDFCTIAKIIREKPEAYFIPLREEQSPATPSDQPQSPQEPQS